MTPAQVNLLKKLLRSQLLYERADPNYPPAEGREWKDPDLRLVEVGPINGCRKNTAESLVVAGIAIYEQPRNATEFSNGFIRLATDDDS